MKTVIKYNGQYIGAHEIVLFKPASKDKVIERLTKAVGDNTSTASGQNFIESRLGDYDRMVNLWNKVYPNKYFIGKVIDIYKLCYTNTSGINNSYAEIRSFELKPKLKSWKYRNDRNILYYYYGYMLDIIRVNKETIHRYGSNIEQEVINSILNSVETKGDICGISVNDIVLTTGDRRSDITTNDITKIIERKSNNT